MTETEKAEQHAARLIEAARQGSQMANIIVATASLIHEERMKAIDKAHQKFY